MYETIVAGTFDYLHRGHMKMLEKAISISDSIVGVTSDDLANNSRGREVREYEKRRDRVEEYCQELSQKYGNDYDIVKVIHPVGKRVFSEDVRNIVISPEAKTIKRVNNINMMRVDKDLRPLNIEVVESVHAEDGKRISSTRIAKGEIDRYGNIIEDESNFVVISDVHYGFFDSKEKNDDILYELEKCLRTSKGGTVIILGDLVHDGTRKEFEEAWSIVDENSERAYFTPGNHDTVNLNKKELEKIVGHKIPKRVRVNGEELYLVDSSTSSNQENIGKISEDSLELVDNIKNESYILSHYPLEYTSFYKESPFFNESPEAVFPVNKNELNLNYEKIKKGIFGHLHLEYSYKTEIPCEILKPFMEFKKDDSIKGEIIGSSRVY